jgi:hypothetical protein
MTNFNVNSRISGAKTNAEREFSSNKAGFDSAVNAGSVKGADSKKVAFAFVVPAWIAYVVGAACITAGAYAVSSILKDIGKILLGEPRTEGSPAKEGLIRQIMGTIKADERFGTLPDDMQQNLMRAESGDSSKKTATKKGSSTITALRKRGPNRPPKNNDKNSAVASNSEDQTSLSIPKMWTSNSLKDLPIKLYRVVADWVEHASVKNPNDFIDIIRIGRAPKANPLNPTNVTSNTDMMAAQDGFVKFQRNLLDGPKTDFFLEITTNGRSRFIDALELYEKLQNKLPH